MGEVLGVTGTGAQLEGVGRLADGRCAFVPFALPGEEVEIAIEKDAGRFVRARLLRVLSPFPAGVVPIVRITGNAAAVRRGTCAMPIPWN